ncbi:MAG TPA: hypothetical protein VJ486_12775, partial [Geothrix sp.]|nr:hypothetical protein [Geothrix sp.]
MNLRRLLGIAIGVFCLVPLLGQKTEVLKGKRQPTELIEQPWVFGTEVIKHWQNLPSQVNAPANRTRAYPGQHLTIAIGARGDLRDQLLKAGTYSFTVTVGTNSSTFNNLHPTQLRRIKAEGADFALAALHAAQITSGEAETMLSMVSFALFDLDWVAPQGTNDGAISVKAKVVGANGAVRDLQERNVEFWSYERLAKEGGFKDKEEQGNWMMGYYQRPEPTRLLHLFRGSKDDKNAFKPNMRAFYRQVLKSDPAAAQDLLTRLRSEEPVVRMVGVVAFLDAGYPLPAILETMSVEDQERFKLIPSKIEPLPDPFDLVPDVNNFIKVPNAFDMLWSQFLATGDAEPVRAIAGALQWRKEGQAFLALRKSGKKPDGITLELAKGLSYMAAGWSLGSFYRNHPLVTDYIEAWKKDASVPLIIREELGTLMANEAFQRD